MLCHPSCKLTLPEGVTHIICGVICQVCRFAGYFRLELSKGRFVPFVSTGAAGHSAGRVLVSCLSCLFVCFVTCYFPSTGVVDLS